MAAPPSGEIEFARPRRATPGRILVALLFPGAATSVVAWQLGWLQRLPLPSFARAPAPAPRVEEIRKRGLMFVEARAAEQSAADSLATLMALPRVVSDRRLDIDVTRATIDGQLSELEEVARKRGAALGVGYPHPVTVARVAAWAKTLEQKGRLVLAPASALGALPGAPK